MSISTLKSVAAALMLTASASAASAQCYLKTVEPASGSTVESLSNITMHWYCPDGTTTADGSSDYWTYDNRLVTLKDAAGNEISTQPIMQQQDWSAGWPPPFFYSVTFDPAVTGDGVYTLTIPAGLFSSDGDAADLNEAVTLTYYIGQAAPVEPEPAAGCFLKSVEPTDGSTVESLSNITMHWYCPDGTTTADGSSDYWTYDNRLVTLKDAAGNEISTQPIMQQQDWSAGWPPPYFYTVTFDPEITGDGVYTLTIPAGLFSSDGDAADLNAATTLTYKIGNGGGNQGGEDPVVPGNVTYNMNYVSILPAAGVITYAKAQTLDNININFSENVYVNPSVKPYIEKPDGSKDVVTKFMNGAAFGAATQIIMGVDDADKYVSGKYTLVLPEGCIGNAEWNSSNHAAGNANPEIRIEYTYTQNPDLIVDEDDGSEFNPTLAEIVFPNGTVVNLLNEPGTYNNIPASSVFRFNSNKNAICKDIYITVRDETTGDHLWFAGTYRQAVTSVEDIRTINGKNADGIFEIELASIFTIELVQGHTYKVDFEVFLQYDGVPEAQRVRKGIYTGTIYGNTAGYTYGNAKIVSIDPNPDTLEITDANDAQFTVTFDKPVTMQESLCKIVGQGSYIQYTSITSNEDGTAWTFAIPSSVANSATGQIDCRIAPRDNGQSLWIEDNAPYKNIYSSGSKASVYQTISMACYLGGKAVEADPASGSVVESLYSFKFTCPTANAKNIGFQGVSASGALLYGNLINAAGATVATLARNSDAIELEASGEYTIGVTMHLDKEVTAPGEYTLVIPGAYFMTGTESASVANKPCYFTYTIEGEPVVATFEPEAIAIGENQKHSHLNIVHTSVKGVAQVASGAQFKLCLDGEEIATADVIAFNHNDNTMIYGHFNGIATAENGVYTVVLPAGSLLSGAATSTEVSAAFSGVSNTVAVPESVNVKMHIGDYASATHTALKGVAHTVAVNDSDDWALDALTVNGKDCTADVAEDGTYTVPAETMNADVEVKATFAYTGEISFDFTSGVESIEGCGYTVVSEGGKLIIKGLSAGDAVKVFTVNGMNVASATASDDILTVTMPAGVYVVTINTTAIKVSHK